VSVRISYAERDRIFGRPGSVARQQVTTPWGLRVWCHELLAGRFLAACQLADRVSRWKPARIDSYAYRDVRGSTSPSLHSYALAWDFFDRPYPQPVDVWGPTNAPTRDFRDAFTAFGFALGADFTTRKDYPHIEWCAGRPLAITAVPPAPDSSAPPLKPRRQRTVFLVQHPNGVVELCALVAGNKVSHVGIEDPADRDAFIAAGVPLVNVTDATWAKWAA
jgi:hypothetical protein